MMRCRCGNSIHGEGEYCERCDSDDYYGEYLGKKRMSRQHYAIAMKLFKKRLFNKIFKSLRETEQLTGGLLIHGR